MKILLKILKILLNIAIIFVTILAVLGVLYFIHGSLEMFPTEEQVNKAQTSAIFIVVFSIFINTILILFRIHIGFLDKRNKKIKGEQL